jgi:hypothetical protein
MFAGTGFHDYEIAVNPSFSGDIIDRQTVLFG